MTTLKNVLVINALSSGATGLGLIVMPDFLATLFATTQAAPFIAVGIFLVVFAAFVLFSSLKNPIGEGSVRLIIMLDAIWVMVSVSIVILQLFDLSGLGYILIVGVAAWVGLMAFLQYNGLKLIRGL
ncbi:MAG: hypothetical protein WKF87_06510 [Chryseolinea sp.]